MNVHISTRFPPPANLEIVVMDEHSRTLARLHFGYEVPVVAERLLQ